MSMPHSTDTMQSLVPYSIVCTLTGILKFTPQLLIQFIRLLQISMFGLQALLQLIQILSCTIKADVRVICYYITHYNQGQHCACIHDVQLCN